MATPKIAHIKLNLSGHTISFSSPTNYSKDFPWPSETKYQINVYDKDIYKNPYTNLELSYSIRESFWDYGRSIFFGGVTGTLSMNMSLIKTSSKGSNIKNSKLFIDALKRDFEVFYDKQAREEFSVVLPEKYQINTISNLDWGVYEFQIGRGEKRTTYAIPVSEEHYLMIVFNFIENSHGKKNNWKEQAKNTVDFIMSSFEIK